MDQKRLTGSIEKTWNDSIIERLIAYVRIPNKSPQFDPTLAGANVLTLFGSVDAHSTVLRIARHRGRCDGGANNGAPCAVASDCLGASCIDACAGGSYSFL